MWEDDLSISVLVNKEDTMDISFSYNKWQPKGVLKIELMYWYEVDEYLPANTTSFDF